MSFQIFSVTIYLIMKTVYIHVGFPKTGTKYLSRNFFSKISKIKNFGKKQSLNDVDEELLLCFNKIMHLPKIDKKDEKMIIRCFKNLNLEERKINFISFEGFTQLNFVIDHYLIFRRLKNLFLKSDIKIKVLVTIRNQLEMIPSHYANSPKLYSKIPINSFKDYISELESKNSKTDANIVRAFDRFKYCGLYYNLIGLFGRKNVRFFLLEELRENKKKFLKDLFNFLNLGKIKKSLYNSQAENVTRRSNNKYLRINKYLIKKLNNSILFKIFLLPFSFSIRQKLYKFSANAIIDTMYFFDPIELSKSQSSIIKKYYHKDNIKLMKILKKNKKISLYYT